MSNEGSVAPKERINIVYRSQVDGGDSEVELPLKMLVVGDFTGREDERMVEERAPINVDRDNFDEVLKAQGLKLNIDVPRVLAGSEDGDRLSVFLDIGCIKDFEPDQIVRQVPELSKLLELRDALRALKGPLSNIPEFRKKIQSLIHDVSLRDALLKELALSEQEG